MIARPAFKAIVVAHLVLLGLLGWHFRHALNTDAVAYLRLASYYTEGNFALAVSGYWGPGLSWLLAVLLKAGLSDLAAARVLMAISAQSFFWGCVAVFRVLRLPFRWFIIGAALAAFASAFWSVHFITPDLLLGGVVMLAVSRMWNEPSAGIQAEAITGALWGLAYLVKAVALPVGVLMLAVFAALEFFRNRGDWALVRRPLLVRAAALALVALPWIAVLSVKYQALTFSTTARLSHTLTGPPDAERYHPFARHFHQPEPGRITSWEDPSRMAYNEWSPFASGEYFHHQLAVLAQNGLTVAVLLTSLNLSWWLVGLAGLRTWMRRESRRTAGWQYARLLTLPAVLGAVYLPFYVTLSEQRFFYAAFPFLFAATAMWAETWSWRLPLWMKPSLVLTNAALPLVSMVLVVNDSPRVAGDWGWQLAQRLRDADQAGPVAGSGALPGGRTGLYVAYHLKQPWLGDDPEATLAKFRQSGAHLVIVRRATHWDADLSVDANFVNLDDALFSSPDEARNCPLKVFAVRTPLRKDETGN